MPCPPEGALITMFSAVLCQSPPTHAPQSSYRHLPSRLLRATLQASYHRILRGLRTRSEDPNVPPLSPLIFGDILEECLLVRRLVRGWMIEEIIRSQAPNRVLMATPLPIDPPEQLLPRSYRCTLSKLRWGYCSRLQSYRHSVGWADDPTCPDCYSTDHTVAYLFSCTRHPTDLAPMDMWVAPSIQAAQFLFWRTNTYLRLNRITNGLWTVQGSSFIHICMYIHIYVNLFILFFK